MVLHVDLNSFFARVEQQANPHLRNRPVGILGKGHKGARTCVCALSPEAKKFGVASGASVWEARRQCPNILLVPPDYPKYLDISRQFMAILGESTPWVEIFSIDEAFLRVDGPLTNSLAVAHQIKKRLRQQLGELLTVSIGIAWGKIFAKLAGELQKPDGLVVLEPTTWLDRIGHLPVTELCGIGYRLNHHLAAMGLATIRDLCTTDAGVMVGRFGRSLGMRLWQIGQGIDQSPVTSSQTLAPAKSIGHQVTLDTDYSLSKINGVLARLTQKVGRRLRRSGQVAHVVELHIALAGGGYWRVHHRHQPPVVYDAALLASVSQLLKTSEFSRWTRVRRVGVVVTQLAPAYAQTLPIFPDALRDELVTNALDTLRNRYGEPIIDWGWAFGTDTGNLRDWRGPRAVLGT